MDINARVAFINSQAVMMHAEIEMMKAENIYRAHRGEVVAYGEQEFSDLISRWDCILGHNAVMEYLA